MSSAADLPDLDQVFRGIPGRHALLLPVEVSPKRYSLAVSSQFPGATMHDDGSVTLIGDTMLKPPRLATEQELDERLIPRLCPIVIDVEGTVRRGESPPFQRAPGIDPICDVFADGLPEGVEWEVVQWLVAAARFLGGAVLLDELPYCPDPEAVGPLTVFSTVWLDPEACLAAVGTVAPARFPERSASDDEPPVLDGYAIEVPLGSSGSIVIEVTEETALPAVVAAHTPPDVDLSMGAIAYTASWYLPDDAEELLAHLDPGTDDDVSLGAELYDGEVLGEDLALARRQANLVLLDVIGVLRAAAGGLIVTRSGFPVLDTGR